MEFLHASSLSILTLVWLILSTRVSGASFTILNNCDYTVWPGILGNSKLETTGFELRPGGSRSFQIPPGWSGRIWGRSGCKFDLTGNQGSCLTGHCGSNQIECNGFGAEPPATLAEFTIGSGKTLDFYDVSLVDGYNLPMVVQPTGGSGSCMTTGCIADLNQRCPAELRSGEGSACKSACEAFGDPQYCCSGPYGSPATCRPSIYSEIFKVACPRSYSYAYDDATSTFTCGGADYSVTFCPSSSSKKTASNTSSVTPSANGGSRSTNPPPEGEGEGEARTVFGSTWLPNFLTGNSSQTLESFSSHSSLIVISCFILLFSSFLI